MSIHAECHFISFAQVNVAHALMHKDTSSEPKHSEKHHERLFDLNPINRHISDFLQSLTLSEKTLRLSKKNVITST